MPGTLDTVDIRILKLLQDNARLTNKEIADKLFKTPTPIHRRIKRLEDEGFIRKYVALLDHKMIDRGLMAFTHVQLLDHSEESLRHFQAEIIKFDEVMECYHISGVYGFTLRVAVKDLENYYDFLMNKLFKLVPHGQVLSTFVMREAKAETAFLLDNTAKSAPAKS